MNARRAIFEGLTGLAMRRLGLRGPAYVETSQGHRARLPGSLLRGDEKHRALDRYLSNGSRGSPRMRSAIVLREISEVPPAMVIARPPM
jgi:hypothetical protein